MVWEAMARSGMGRLHFINGYVSIIDKYVKQNSQVCAGNHLVFRKTTLLATQRKQTNIFSRTKLTS